MYKHGCARDYHQHRLYNIWQNMKQRCYGNKHNSYLYKNINVCDEWIDSFINFRDWSLNNGYKDDLSIDRIDGCRDYCPNNCRWATQAQQQCNTKANWIIILNGREMCLSQAAKTLNLRIDNLRYKLVSNGIKPKDKVIIDNFIK